MILIENIVIDPQIITQQFVCALERCKGGCCVSGKQGAPLEVEEVEVLEEIQEIILPFLTPEGRLAVEEQGTSVALMKGKFVTPTLKRNGQNNQACAYVCYEENGTAKCAIEVAFHQKKISFQKPISCHL
ncbi:MAG: DUF3109 family protein, partial [Planctomycetota bacterium]